MVFDADFKHEMTQQMVAAISFALELDAEVMIDDIKQIRKVINTKEDHRETLLNYARTINEEIRIKRREFGLPLD